MRSPLDQALFKSGSLGTFGVMAAILGGAMSVGGTAWADGCGATIDYQVICDGDLSSGVSLDFDTTIRTALIQDLTADIGANGISLTSADQMNLTVDTGNYAVQAVGNKAINVVTWGSSGANLDVTGTITSDTIAIYTSTIAGDLNITTDGTVAGQRGVVVYQLGFDDINLTFAGTVSGTTGSAVYASGNGNITLESTADITSGSNSVTGDFGMNLAATGGNIIINQTGDVLTFGNTAIRASAANGDITMTSDGAINATGGTGVSLVNMSGPHEIKVDHTGSITATNDAMNLQGNGVIDVKVVGDINGGDAGIRTTAMSGGNTKITHEGAITSATLGIVAQASSDDIVITNTGNINSGADAIKAQILGAGALEITQVGTITSATRGIYAFGSTGTVDVLSTGTIDASGDAVSVLGYGDSLHVAQTGDLTSTNGRGVTMESGNAELLVDGSGSISGASYGVYLYSMGTGKTASFVHDSGTITASNGKGVYVYTGSYASGGNASVDNTANVIASGDGIYVQTQGDGTTASILQYGNVTANTADSGNHNALYARSSTGNASITGAGDIVMQGSGDAIRVTSYAALGHTAAVEWQDNVTAIDGAAVSISTGTGAIAFDLTGNYTANARVGTSGVNTISLSNYGMGNIYGAVNGTVTRDFTDGGTTGNAIFAAMQGNTGNIGINMTGTILSSGSGMVAQSASQNSTWLENYGSITAGYNLGAVTDSAADAMRLEFMGYARADNYGDLTAARDGIHARTTSGGVGSTPIIVNNQGTITAGRDGIHMTSVDNGVVASVISATSDGDITAVNDGIYAQTSGQQNIVVDITGGVVDGGANGVEFSGGYQNALTNHGTIKSTLGTSILANDSDTTIHNYGLVMGNVLLERVNDATNQFNNYADAEFDMGSSVDLGAWNQLVNDGLVRIGQDNDIATTAVRGALVNNSDGVLSFDIDMSGGTSDQIIITDGDATLAGKIGLHFTTLSTATPLSFTLIYAEDGVDLQSSLDAASPFVDASLDNPDGQSVVLTVNGFTFAPSGIIGNAKQMGLHLNTAMGLPGTNLDGIAAALVSVSSLEDGQDALAQMSPEAELGRKWADAQLAGDFGDLLVNRSGDPVSWVQAQTLSLASATGDANSAFNMHGGRMMAGGQTSTDGAVKLGLAVGVSTSDLTTDAGASSSGQSLDLGAVVRYDNGPIALAAAVSASHGNFAGARDVSFDGFDNSLTSDRSHDTLNLNMRASYLIGSESSYLRPSLGLNEAVVTTGAGTETGGDAALIYDRETTTTVRVSPALEVGLTQSDANGGQSKSWLRVTRTFQPNDAQSLKTAFAGSDAGSGTATVTGLHEPAFTTVAFGLDLHNANNTDFQLSYDTRLGDVTTYGALSAKFSLHF